MKRIIIFSLLFLPFFLSGQKIIKNDSKVLFVSTKYNNIWFVRPLGGSYGTEDGTSYANAFDGFIDIEWSSIGAKDLLLVYGNHTEALDIQADNFYIKFNINSYIDATGIDEGLTIANRTGVMIERAKVINATVSNIEISGTSSDIIVSNVTCTGSGNQNFQMLDNSSATFYNIVGNNAIDDGFSMHDNTTATIHGGTFTGNDLGMGTIESAKLTAYNCYLTNNASNDIGTDFADSDSSAYVIAIGCKIIQTGSSQLYAENQAYLELWYCDITAGTNHIADIGGSNSSDYAHFGANYCIFNDMAASKDAVVARADSYITLRNCVIYGSGTKTGIGVGCVSGSVTVANNTIFSNLDKGLYALSGSTVTSNNSCYYDNTTDKQGTITANNDVTGNPNLSNPANNQFWITAGSSCINTGLDLGSTYQLGLNQTTIFPKPINKLNQNDYGVGWDIGIYIYIE